MPVEILPSIDLRGGRVVRLKQGDYQRQITYDVDAMDVVASYADAGATRMHVVDLDGAREGRVVQAELIAKMIAATEMSVQVGGGVRGDDDVRRLIDAGASAVVVGTRALEDWAWFEKLARQKDLAGKLTLAIDARDGVVATRGWTESSGQKAADVAAKVRGWPLAALLYTDVARDGMMGGPNVEQTVRLAEATDVRVIASGGVGTLDHIRALANTPVWGCIVGRALYEGAFRLGEALQAGGARQRLIAGAVLHSDAADFAKDFDEVVGDRGAYYLVPGLARTFAVGPLESAVKETFEEDRPGCYVDLCVVAVEPRDVEFDRIVDDLLRHFGAPDQDVTHVFGISRVYRMDSEEAAGAAMERVLKDLLGDDFPMG